MSRGIGWYAVPMVRTLTSHRVGYALALALFTLACGSPSDETLLRRFPAARAPMEEALSLVPVQRPFVRIAPSGSDPKMSEEQLARIRSLLDRAGIDEGLLIRDGVPLFLVDAHGMVGRGWAKGYAYVQREPPPGSLRTNLNDPRALPRDGLFLRPIPEAPSWYLFVDR